MWRGFQFAANPSPRRKAGVGERGSNAKAKMKNAKAKVKNAKGKVKRMIGRMGGPNVAGQRHWSLVIFGFSLLQS
jgi:hypothetical protein